MSNLFKRGNIGCYWERGRRQSLWKIHKKNDFRLSRSPANSFCLLIKNPPRVIVALAGLPHMPALAHVSFRDWRPTPPLLYTWAKFVQQFFIEWVKDMGVLVVVRPHSSPGRQTRTQSWPSAKHRSILKHPVHA